MQGPGVLCYWQVIFYYVHRYLLQFEWTIWKFNIKQNSIKALYIFGSECLSREFGEVLRKNSANDLNAVDILFAIFKPEDKLDSCSMLEETAEIVEFHDFPEGCKIFQPWFDLYL